VSRFLSNLPEKLRSPEERRGFVRRLCKMEASCQPISQHRSEESWPARIRDLSEGGVGLFLNRRFEIGTLLILEMPNSDSKSPYLFLIRVARLVTLSKDKWFLGCTLNPEIDNDDVKTLVAAAAGHPQPE